MRRPTLLYSVTLALLLPLVAQGGQQRPIDDPAVFEGAAVNSFVLPYRYVGSDRTPELDLASRQISGLVHFEILFSLLKYGDVGGSDLVAAPGSVFNVDEVIERVTKDVGPGVLRPGRVLVVTWGRLFEQGDQLYVQSYLRFMRRGEKELVPETISVQLAGADARLELAAALPAQSIAFPPRRISKKDLARVDAEFRRSMVVRQERSLDAPGQSIDFGAGDSFPYSIMRAEGEWIWIEPMRDGPKGWVRARIGDHGGPDSFSLQRWLPELAYVDAIAGFMRLRGGVEGAGAASMRASISDGFTRFERAVSAEEARAPYGLARAVQGFVAWDLGDPKNRADAARLFAEARALMPEYADARNLAAVTQPLLDAKGLDKASAATLGRDLAGALALDPDDTVVLGNLERVYTVFAAQPTLSPFTQEELSRRMAVVRAVQAGPSLSPPVLVPH